MTMKDYILAQMEDVLESQVKAYNEIPVYAENARHFKMIDIGHTQRMIKERKAQPQQEPKP